MKRQPNRGADLPEPVAFAVLSGVVAGVLLSVGVILWAALSIAFSMLGAPL